MTNMMNAVIVYLHLHRGVHITSHISGQEDSSTGAISLFLTFLLCLLVCSQNDVLSFQFTLFKYLHKYL